MGLSEMKDRWNVWTVQARNFARRENYTDAVARMKLVQQSVEDMLAEVVDPVEKRRVQAHLARANELLAELEADYDAWRSKIAARRQHTIDSAAEEMSRPLPTATDPQ